VRFLVDTHTFLWAVRSPEELTCRAREILADPSAELLISIAVPWEMAIKSGLGKLDTQNILDDFDRIIVAGGYRLLETQTRHVIQSGYLTLHHRDPFDRLLAAQALDIHVPIISCDEKLDLYGVARVWS
jgi:PIN domain nuclease of toxin-antitoxin system